MVKKLYVANLPFTSTEDEVSAALSQFGEVSSVNLISDRQTGRSRGFGFVEIDTDTEPQDMSLELGGRRLTIDLAKERPPKR